MRAYPLVIVVSLLATGSARASVADLFGLGGVEPALAGASAARVAGAAAAHYNPAGLERLERSEAAVGVLGYGSRLTINGRVPPGLGISDPVGIYVGAATPVPFGGVLERRIFVGLALFVVRDVVRVIARAPDEPFFPYYENRTQRLIVLPALAVRLGGGVSVGIAGNYLARLAGRVAVDEGAARAPAARVDEQVVSTLRANVGVSWRSPHDRVAAALVYRQAFSVPFATDANTRIAGQPLDVDVDAEGLFTPHQLTLGGLLRPRAWLALSADVTWGLWSRWRGPWVTVSSTLPLAGALDVAPPRLDYRDTVTVRVGGEATLPVARGRLGLALRAGAAFESSPIPAAQPGVTNLLDGHKGIVAAGVGLRAPLGRVALRVDALGQIQIVGTRTITKRLAAPDERPPATEALRDEVPDDPDRPETLGPQVTNPGWPTIRGGGFAWAAGLTLTVER